MHLLILAGCHVESVRPYAGAATLGFRKKPYYRNIGHRAFASNLFKGNKESSERACAAIRLPSATCSLWQTEKTWKRHSHATVLSDSSKPVFPQSTFCSKHANHFVPFSPLAFVFGFFVLYMYLCVKTFIFSTFFCGCYLYVITCYVAAYYCQV